MRQLLEEQEERTWMDGFSGDAFGQACDRWMTVLLFTVGAVGIPYTMYQLLQIFLSL